MILSAALCAAAPEFAQAQTTGFATYLQQRHQGPANITGHKFVYD